MNARGDYLLNLPTIRALASIFPGSLRLICRPGARAVFFPRLHFAEVIEPETTCKDLQYYFDAERVAATLGRADLLLCLNPVRGKSSTHLLRLLNPASSIGFDNSFSTHIPLDFGKHNADLAFSVAQALDPTLRIEEFAYPPELARDSVMLSETILSNLPTNYSAVMIHTDTKSEKMWTSARWHALVERLLDKYPKLFVFNIGLSDSDLDGVRFCERVVPCGCLHLSAAMALVERANLFIGVDSCFLHAADLARVPGVGLFGPTSVQEFGFRFGPHRHVVGPGNLAPVGVDEVFAAVESLHQELGCLSGRDGAAYVQRAL
jgi:ADP-heptose:LPS heptosyltransferase